MTGSPTGARPPAGTPGPDERDTPSPLRRPTSCARRRRPQGPPAADAVELRSSLDPGAYPGASTHPAKPAEERSLHLLTDPAPSGMTRIAVDQRFLWRSVAHDRHHGHLSARFRTTVRTTPGDHRP